MLKDRIEQEYKEAMKAKDVVKISVIRMLKSDLKNLSIQKQEEIKEEGIVKVLHKHVKQRKDSIEQFAKGNRDDLVKKEKQELAILESFLPKMMPPAELEKLIKDVIAETGATSKKDMGGVMKEVLVKAKGTADGKAVSQIVSNLLP